MERKETFVVNVYSQENLTWQGQVTWLDKRETRNFRSLLELIKLMDAALEGDRDLCVEKEEHV